MLTTACPAIFACAGRRRPVAWRPIRLVTHAPFRRLPIELLATLEDAELLGYVARAKRSGELEDARTAVWLLWDRHGRAMRRRVQLRIPAHLQHHLDTVSDWVTERVLQTALRLSLEGSSPGEWTRYWQQAVDRQTISFWRTSQGRSLERQQGLPSEQDGEDGTAPDRLGEELDVERLIARACHHEIIEGVLDRMDNANHVAIVRMACFEDLASAVVAERLGETAVNVDQVKSRFRAALRRALEDRGITGP